MISRSTSRYAVDRGSTAAETPVGLLAQSAAEKWPERTFTSVGDQDLTFTALTRWVDITATDLVAHGVGAGSKVLVFLPNGFEVLLYQLAAWRIGAIAVPVVPIYRKHELAYIINDVRPSAVITVPALRDRNTRQELEELLADAGLTDVAKYLVGGRAEGWLPIPGAEDDHLQGTSLPEPSGPDETSLILFTSGTTSSPKGAMLSSRSIMRATQIWLDVAGIGPEDVGLAVAPLSHIAGLVSGAFVPLVVGCRSVIVGRWDPDDAVRLIDRHKATFGAGATVFLQDLIERYALLPPNVHRITFFVSGGAATPPDLIRRADAAGIHATRAYGMTETGGVITMASQHEELERRATYDGKVAPGVELVIVDDDGNEVPPGEEGHVRIRSEQVMVGYTDPVITSQQMKDGWFAPGDRGLVTYDGWFRMTGRTKDIINRGGEKFSASDIEAGVLGHPDIARVAVAAVPHERFGEEVGAWVVLADGAVWDGPEAVLDHLDNIGMARAKFPTVWTVVSQLPTTPSGKVQKHKLADLVTLEGAHHA